MLAQDASFGWSIFVHENFMASFAFDDPGRSQPAVGPVPGHGRGHSALEIPGGRITEFLDRLFDAQGLGMDEKSEPRRIERGFSVEHRKDLPQAPSRGLRRPRRQGHARGCGSGRAGDDLDHPPDGQDFPPGDVVDLARPSLVRAEQGAVDQVVDVNGRLKNFPPGDENEPAAGDGANDPWQFRNFLITDVD